MRDLLVIGATVWAALLFLSIIAGCLLQTRFDQDDSIT